MSFALIVSGIFVGFAWKHSRTASPAISIWAPNMLGLDWISGRYSQVRPWILCSLYVHFNEGIDYVEDMLTSRRDLNYSLPCCRAYHENQNNLSRNAAD